MTFQYSAALLRFLSLSSLIVKIAFVDACRPEVRLSTGVNILRLFAKMPQASLYPFFYIVVTHCSFVGVESFVDEEVCIRRSSQSLGGRSAADSFSQQTFLSLWPPYVYQRPRPT